MNEKDTMMKKYVEIFSECKKNYFKYFNMWSGDGDNDCRSTDGVSR